MNKLKIFNKQNTKGFTLVELLVVVAIIAILSTIGLVIFSDAQKNARDARRKNDIDAIAKALEQSRTPTSTYYGNLGTGSFSNGTVPVDTTTQQYCIRTTTGTTGIPSTEPTTTEIGNWTGTVVCPNNTNWTAIPSGGYTMPTSTTFWKVCAKLETGTGTNAIYCKNSAQ